MRQGVAFFFLKAFSKRFQITLRCLLSLALTQPAGIYVFAMNPPAAFHKTAPTSKPDAQARKKIAQAYGGLPLFFEKNEGQTDPSVRFTARGKGYSLYLTPTQAVWCFQKYLRRKKLKDPKKSVLSKPEYLWMKLKGANPRCEAEGLDELPGKSNYFIGNSNHWRSGLSQYARVKFKEVYPHIDLVYYGANGKLEYDFVVKPGGNPQDIQLKFLGAKDLPKLAGGNLGMKVGKSHLIMSLPSVYQKNWIGKKDVSGRFVKNKEGEVGFEVEGYDPTKTLVIDPALTLAYSTYVGANVSFGNNEFQSLAVDPGGDAYLVEAYEAGFTGTPGAYQPTANAENVLIFKLNPTATGLVYATYLGGSGYDVPYAVTADASGDAFVTGTTNSPDFPVTPGAFQTTQGSPVPLNNGNAFVSKLNPTGTVLVYSTFLGGSPPAGNDVGYGIAVDASDNAYITGEAESANFPVTPGAFQTTVTWSGGNAAFITKLNSTGTALVYSTYLGGSNDDFAQSIALDGSGDAYVTGQATSSNFPVTPGAFQSTLGSTNGNAFVTKLNPIGTALIYSTYLGGSTLDIGRAIAVDSLGNAIMTGETQSNNFPVSPGAFQPTLGSTNGNAFVTKLNPTGTTLAFSTYLGGSGPSLYTGFLDEGLGIAVDGSGNSYVSGNTLASNFPTTPGAFQASWGGSTESTFWSIFNSSGGLAYSTYWGGTANGDICDDGAQIALDGSGGLYVGGCTYATDFPITAGVYKITIGPEGEDMFVSKFVYVTPTPTATSASTPTNSPTPTPTLTATSTPTSTPTSTSTVTITPTPYTSTFTSTFTPTCVTHLWPDPFNPNYANGGFLKVDCLPPRATVTFYTVSGELVRNLSENGGMVQWDGHNQNGSRVSLGVYYYVIQQGTSVLGRGKILVTNNH